MDDHQKASDARPRPKRGADAELAKELREAVKRFWDTMGPDLFAELKAENKRLRRRIAELGG